MKESITLNKANNPEEGFDEENLAHKRQEKIFGRDYPKGVSDAMQDAWEAQDIAEVKVKAAEEASKFAKKEAIQAKEESEKSKQEAEIDNLTGIQNRTAFDKNIERVFAHVDKITFLLLDLDRFKSFNDTYGHQTGDEVLILAAKKLREQFRESDIYRYGGEEFVVALAGMDEKSTAHLLAQKELQIPLPRGRHADALKKVDPNTIITFSGGFAETKINKENISSLKNDIRQALSKADEALYSAKRDGRNRIYSSSELDREQISAE